MTVRVGINGFGRIGRQVLKAIIERHAASSRSSPSTILPTPSTNALLFKYDSNYGAFTGDGRGRTDGALVINGKPSRSSRQRDPGDACPGRAVGVEIVVESTGLFTDAPKAAAHITGGAKKVIISAPAKGEDITIVLGVNEGKYDPGQAHRHLQRVLHDQLPGARGQGRQRQLRHRQGA